MKKWIPKGLYCHGDDTKKNPPCKWLKHIKTIKRNKSNCEYALTCNEKCWTTRNNSCQDLIYRCDYLGYTDWKQESLLWDECKECEVKKYV